MTERRASKNADYRGLNADLTQTSRGKLRGTNAERKQSLDFSESKPPIEGRCPKDGGVRKQFGNLRSNYQNENTIQK